MRLRAGDRYLFKGLEGDSDPLAGRLEITLLAAMHDGHIVHRVTFPDGIGEVDRSIPISDVTRMIECGIWEPMPAEAEK